MMCSLANKIVVFGTTRIRQCAGGLKGIFPGLYAIASNDHSMKVTALFECFKCCLLKVSTCTVCCCLLFTSSVKSSS